MQSGDIIESGNEVWEVTEYNEDTEVLEIKVLRCSPEVISYLSVGHSYLLNKDECGGRSIWEIPPEDLNQEGIRIFLVDGVIETQGCDYV